MRCVNAAAVVIAALALVVSVVTALRQWLFEGRASFTAEWESRDRVVCVNHGPGTAKDVRIDVPGNLLGDTGEAATVPPRQYVRIPVSRSIGTGPIEQVIVSWRDNGFRGRRRSETLSLSAPPSTGATTQPKRGELEKAVRAIAADVAAREYTKRVAKARRDMR